MAELVGISNFMSKKGYECHTITVLKACTARDEENGSYGHKAETIFLPDSLAKKVSVKDIGKNITISYDVNAGRAYVVDVSVN